MNERERAFREYLEQFTDYSEQRIDLAVEWVRFFYREGVQGTGVSGGNLTGSPDGNNTSSREGDTPGVSDNNARKPGSVTGDAVARFEAGIARRYNRHTARVAGDAIRHFLYFRRRFDVTRAIDVETDCAGILKELKERFRRSSSVTTHCCSCTAQCSVIPSTASPA